MDALRCRARRALSEGSGAVASRAALATSSCSTPMVQLDIESQLCDQQTSTLQSRARSSLRAAVHDGSLLLGKQSMDALRCRSRRALSEGHLDALRCRARRALRKESLDRSRRLWPTTIHEILAFRDSSPQLSPAHSARCCSTSDPSIQQATREAKK